MSHFDVLSEIDTFLTQHRMADSTFGRLAVNDGKFLRRIRAGGRMWPETVARVRAFMQQHEAAEEAQA